MKVVELTTPAQGVDVEELAVQHHDEYGGSREFDRKAVGEACFQCVLHKKHDLVNCWIAYDDDDQPIGYLAGSIRPSFYSYRRYAVQEMWYVVPRARGTRAAIELLVQFERWAISRDAERIYTQVEHDADDELVERVFKLLTRLGYKKQGYIAVKINSNKELNNDRTTHREVGAGQATAQT